MREISTKKIELGEHVLIDGVEYVAEEGCCYDCHFSESLNRYCPCVPFCHVGVKLTKVEKQLTEKKEEDR